MRVVGLDISTTSTGIAVIGLGGRTTARVSRVRTSPAETPEGVRPSLQQRHERFMEIEAGVIAALSRDAGLGPISLVVVEGPSYLSTGFAQHDISGNWHRVVRAVLAWGLPVAEVSPGQVKLYATGSGATHGKNKVTKQHVINAVRGNYPSAISEQAKQTDKADALILAAIGCRRLGHPIEVSPLSEKQVGVVHDLRWPDGLPENPIQQGELNL